MFIFDLLIIFLIFYFLSKLFWPRRSQQSESYDQFERSGSQGDRQAVRVKRRVTDLKNSNRNDDKLSSAFKRTEVSSNRSPHRARRNYSQYYEKQEVTNDRRASKGKSNSQKNRRKAASLDSGQRLIEEDSLIYSPQVKQGYQDDQFASMNDFSSMDDFSSMNDFSDMEFQEEHSLQDKLAMDVTQTQVSDTIGVNTNKTNRHHSKRSAKGSSRMRNLQKAVIWSEILQLPKSLRK